MLNKIANHQVDRRLVLKGAAAGGLGIAGATMLAGCATDAATGPVSFGARTVDENPTKQLQALIAAYTAKTGNEVTYNATESNAFQNNLSQYLQGTPDDCFQWMAGFICSSLLHRVFWLTFPMSGMRSVTSTTRATRLLPPV